MLTSKQLEAVYWVANLGGFAQAAQRLHTSQSAVSKRVQELEAHFDMPLFDRSLRSARLTDKGEEMYAVASRLLAQRDEALERFQRPEVHERRLRIGVTELTAMTWFPRLVGHLHSIYPRVVIEPEVDASVTLREKVLTSELDVAVVPDLPDDVRLTKHPVGLVRNAWMCKPGAMALRRMYSLNDLASQRLLTQGDRSGTGIAYSRWLKSFGLEPKQTIASNNMIAIIGMTVSGLGISHLPKDCLRPLITAGLLQIVAVKPALPTISYVAMYRNDQRSTFISAVAAATRDCCDFSQAFQTAA